VGDEEFLETRRFHWPVEEFIADPQLFNFIRDCWENKRWEVLFDGIVPVGAVMAEMEDGTLTLWFKARPPGE
jgi:hypothetical protein